MHFFVMPTGPNPAQILIPAALWEFSIMTLLTSHTTLPDIFRTFLATMVVKLQTLRNHFAKLAIPFK